MSYPVPTHLREILEPHPRKTTAHQVQGSVRCPCGSYVLSLLYVGNRAEVKGAPFLQITQVGDRYLFCLGARCIACNAEHLLFDDRFHGWNGTVCSSDEEQAEERPPFLAWHCAACDSEQHKITVTLQGEEMKTASAESEGLLNAQNWGDGFAWITVDLTCMSCKQGPTEVVSLETM